MASKPISRRKVKPFRAQDRRISRLRSRSICWVVQKRDEENCQESIAQHYSLERRWLEGKHPVTDHDCHDQPKENQQKRNNDKVLWIVLRSIQWTTIIEAELGQNGVLNRRNHQEIYRDFKSGELHHQQPLKGIKKSSWNLLLSAILQRVVWINHQTSQTTTKN